MRMSRRIKGAGGLQCARMPAKQAGIFQHPPDESRGFSDQLRRELLEPFEKRVCERSGSGRGPANVLSDISDWTGNARHPQAIPICFMLDYTNASPGFRKDPGQLPPDIFSYSGRPQYRRQNEKALATGLPPIAVVFRAACLPEPFRAARDRWGSRLTISRTQFAGRVSIVGANPEGIGGPS